MQYKEKVETRLSELNKGDFDSDEFQDERSQLLELRKQACSTDWN